MKLKKGDQIYYVPDHATGPDHPDSEQGFVVRQTPDPKGETFFCRYYWKQRPEELRTTANGESTHIRNIVKKDHRPQSSIEADILKYNI